VEKIPRFFLIAFLNSPCYETPKKRDKKKPIKKTNCPCCKGGPCLLRPHHHLPAALPQTSEPTIQYRGDSEMGHKRD
jgi:hypothetical protein